MEASCQASYICDHKTTRTAHHLEDIKPRTCDDHKDKTSPPEPLILLAFLQMAEFVAVEVVPSSVDFGAGTFEQLRRLVNSGLSAIYTAC